MPDRMNWLTTDGISWAGPLKVVHTVPGDFQRPDPEASALCGARGRWYEDYDHRDGGIECADCLAVEHARKGWTP